MTEILFIIGGSVFCILGLFHAVYTFLDIKRPRRLVPDDPMVIQTMSNSNVRISQGGTTMWRAWVGFNFSHSLGAVMFGVCCVLLGLSLKLFDLPATILLAPVAISVIYLWLAIQYWFRIPAFGIAICTICFALGWLMY
jgi:hypothetical protein